MPFADINGTTIHYRVDGPAEGPVVMLGNSLASGLGMWDSQVDVLVSAGYWVLRYDGRGHGRSGVPEGPYTIEQLAADAIALVDALDIESFSFCGCSLGGMVGQLLGARHGDRLKSLVLLATTAHMPVKDVWDERIAAVRERGMGAVADATIERWFTQSGRERLVEEVERIRQGILDTPVEGYCACAVGIRDMDQRASLRDIGVPTMIVVGEHDPGTPISAAEFLHERIAGSELTVLPDAAHLANIEQSGAFNDTLMSFLSRASARR